ncbi:MAG: hypothetical protein A3C50_02660 [Candidatus Staskawiczbacteria bacterium RIFCSPHIGHO2_02_FULL_43_16]|uniref:General secretion pathway GspH domain-containing protein n=1 Tax=Candidatus Staskawiczbacteria bacterium RIFCSPHIGHO2_01_FULL_41_41 TaxID=1802203 RepID=A0A1G2HX33_9BACT|nr:MAG: hypothetical protein A2822_01430 [Candidatus Staskawiczbacteria bacterium RIFCSPHIGHO2_01_FULL_41_41]OGZ68185.1 MAG: hypothetical protein A3C50_02660 [Candidatus Staskawiczbacteria bacterium RIFCSPHIGHO2_02_FULL_43_16]OGZ74975.1 MAG: hypothetical protein A3A12_04060 [Candidatus Staskawiczbacteria bacterium RIFCSPLOWO2_01_FULL_43_17b]
MISNFKFQISNYNSSKGFTLLELVVVLGLFMLIMGVTVSMFISIIQHQKRILSQQEMLNQASYVQEYIARSLRTAAVDTAGTCLVQDAVAYKGYTYLLTRFDAPTGFFQGIQFISGEGVCQEFFLDSDGTFKETKNGGAPQNLISGKFKLQHARFVINGNKNTWATLVGGAVWPRVTLSLAIKDSSYEKSREIVIQTTISKR